MRKTIHQFAIPFAVFFFSTSGAFAQIFPLNPSKYRIIPAPEFSTGYPASAGAFNWIDSNRLIFVVNDKQLSTTERRGDQTVVTKGVPTIHLWDFSVGTIRRYRDEPVAHHLCAVDGRVWYGLKRDDRVVVFEGNFGEEGERKPTPHRMSGTSPVTPRINRFSCKEYWFTEVPRPNHGSAMPLRDEHGVFEQAALPGEIKQGVYVRPFKYWNHRGGDSIEISLSEEDANIPLEYSFLAKGYLFHRQENRLERGIPNRFFLWDPANNTVRTLDVLGSENWTALFDPRLTQAGLVAVSRTPTKNRRAKWDVGPAGIYLFGGAPIDEFKNPRATRSSAEGRIADIQPRPLTVEQIVRGIIDQISAISPDGCKVAAVVDPWDGEHRRYRFEVIDFCSRGG